MKLLLRDILGDWQLEDNFPNHLQACYSLLSCGFCCILMKVRDKKDIICPVHLPGQNIFCPGQNQICPRQNDFVNDKIILSMTKYSLSMTKILSTA